MFTKSQMVTADSAVKVRGRALYDWARRGIDVEALPREVEVYNVRIEEIRLPEVTFTVSCSKGTYIRSLCAEVGETLGCGGCMSVLRRIRSGCFREEQALTMEDMKAQEKKSFLAAHLMPMAEVLPGMAVIDADPALAVYFGAHQSIGCKGIVLFGNEEQKQKWLPRCGCVAGGEVAERVSAGWRDSRPLSYSFF